MGLLITFLLGMFMIAGAVIAARVKNKELIEQLSIAIAFGTMTALVIIELIPEALENLEGESAVLLPVCVIAGIIILKVLDHFIPEHDHAHGFHHNCSEQNVIHIGVVSTVAITLHNIIEGMAVYSISREGLKLGLLMALGVGIHNIPMGMIIYSTLQKEKRRKKTVLLSLAACSTFLGGIFMKVLWNQISDMVIGLLISLTLGMIVYIILFELIPHLMHGEKKGLSLAGTILGAAVILVSSFFG